MARAPQRTRTARARYTAKKSPKARDRYLLVGLGLLVLVGIGLLLADIRVAPKDLPTWEGHADALRALNGQIQRLAARRPAGPEARNVDPWLDELQQVLDRIHQIAVDGAVGDRAEFGEFKDVLSRTRDLLIEAFPGEAWAPHRATALEYLPVWR